jgi:hypothetical protein
MKLIATILSHPHPMNIAKSLTQGIFVRAFVTPNATTIVCANKRIKSLPEKFINAIATDAEIDAPL